MVGPIFGMLFGQFGLPQKSDCLYGEPAGIFFLRRRSFLIGISRTLLLACGVARSRKLVTMCYGAANLFNVFGENVQLPFRLILRLI